MSPRVVVVGSSNTDLVLACPRIPRPGETILGGEFARFAGGKGANQAVAAARAGATVSFVGARGNDDFGRMARQALRKEGIDVRHFRVKDAVSSGVALILLGGKGRENLIGVARSANDILAPADVLAAEALVRRANAIVAQLETPLETVEAAAELARVHQVPFILNPAPARKLPARLLSRVTVLTPNEHEARLLAGTDSLEAAANTLRKRGCAAVVITLGKKGVLLCDDSGLAQIPTPLVRAVDTVGAGDCFSAWLAVGIARQLPLRRAAEIAVRAAAIAVTRPGAQAGMPFAQEVSGSPLERVDGLA